MTSRWKLLNYITQWSSFQSKSIDHGKLYYFYFYFKILLLLLLIYIIIIIIIIITTTKQYNITILHYNINIFFLQFCCLMKPIDHSFIKLLSICLSPGHWKIQLLRKGKSLWSVARVTARKTEAVEFVGNFSSIFQSIFATSSISVSWSRQVATIARDLWIYSGFALQVASQATSFQGRAGENYSKKGILITPPLSVKRVITTWDLCHLMRPWWEQ